MNKKRKHNLDFIVNKILQSPSADVFYIIKNLREKVFSNKTLNRRSHLDNLYKDILEHDEVSYKYFDALVKRVKKTRKCKKDPFFFETNVKDKERHISVVDINKSNLSVIRRIRTSNKEYYQFIEAYECRECHCLHVKTKTQIPRSVMQEHTIKLI